MSCRECASTSKSKIKGMDPLLEIKRYQWPKLRDLYLANWPFGVEGYCFLDMLIKNPGIQSSFNITVYCPNGEINRGMIAVSNIETYHLYIYPIKLDDLLGLEAALLTTAVVNWKNDIIIPSVMPEVMNIIDRIGECLKMEVKCNGFVIKYLYNKDSAPFMDVQPPIQTYVSVLKTQDLDIVDKTWTFQSCTSKRYFKRLMDNNLTYVLYSSYDIPLAWVNVDETGALSHLYTLEGCRRQGYGAFITKTAVNDLLAKGQNILTYTLPDNFSSQKLFVRLGFQNIGLTSWVFLSTKITEETVSEAPSCSFCQVIDF